MKTNLQSELDSAEFAWPMCNDKRWLVGVLLCWCVTYFYVHGANDLPWELHRKFLMACLLSAESAECSALSCLLVLFNDQFIKGLTKV